MNIIQSNSLKKSLSLLLAIMFLITAFAGCSKNDDESSSAGSSDAVSAGAESSIGDDFSVSEPSSSEEPSEPDNSSNIDDPSDDPSTPEDDFKPVRLPKPQVEITDNPDKSHGNGYRPSPFDYGYSTPEDIEDNIFWDSLIYTGYNIEKHLADGLMWEYILAGTKKEKGWLSNIGYAGGSWGYETTADGKPDIEYFEKHGLVCASYIAYVYFNYLPNVCGIDTSDLAKPTLSYSANDWYLACQKWVEDGYCRTIDFKASRSGGMIKFEPAEEIPIGSIICFRNITNSEGDFCRHVCIYAGYKNGYHWVYHVGNDNGPEFCAVERMSFGEGAQWPTAIFTTPNFILDAMY